MGSLPTQMSLSFNGHRIPSTKGYGLACSRYIFCFFFSSRRRHTRFDCDWSSDVCSSDLHSFGGLIAQILAGRGLAAVTVAIDPAPFRGVLPLPISTLKSAWPVLRKPSNRNRAVPLTFDQFRYAFANAVSEDEAKELYEKFAVPASGKPLFQSGAANLNPWTEAKVEKNPERGPLLILDGEKDHVVPWAIAHSTFKQQEGDNLVTEIEKIPDTGHSITIDHGWRNVADKSLAFVQRYLTIPEITASA